MRAVGQQPSLRERAGGQDGRAADDAPERLEPSPRPGRRGRTVKYSGYLEHMDKPFDSNCYRKIPRLMKLGEEITLWGMEVGLLTMRKGELARFLFKPRYAYGALGCPPLIPPNTTVLFELELLDFLDSAESDEFFALTAKQQDVFPLEKVLKVAATEREFGNYLFRQNRFHDAKERYKRASLILCRRPFHPGEQGQIESAKLLVFLNLSFTYLKLDRPTRALVYGEQALAIDQKNAKALFRCGQACLILTEYEKARDFLVRAQREQPLNHDINNELKKLASCYRHYMDKEKEMCYRIFFSAPFLCCGTELKVSGPPVWCAALRSSRRKEEGFMWWIQDPGVRAAPFSGSSLPLPAWRRRPRFTGLCPVGGVHLFAWGGVLLVPPHVGTSLIKAVVSHRCQRPQRTQACAAPSIQITPRARNNHALPHSTVT
uniref:peptidylprolyl isomerase n=1 Tax=Monodelphis domestica TaxID=13616 RepID=A0A5F8HCM7_MONDO